MNTFGVTIFCVAFAVAHAGIHGVGLVGPAAPGVVVAGPSAEAAIVGPDGSHTAAAAAGGAVVAAPLHGGAVAASVVPGAVGIGHGLGVGIGHGLGVGIGHGLGVGIGHGVGVGVVAPAIAPAVVAPVGVTVPIRGIGLHGGLHPLAPGSGLEGQYVHDHSELLYDDGQYRGEIIGHGIALGHGIGIGHGIGLGHGHY